MQIADLVATAGVAPEATVDCPTVISPAAVRVVFLVGTMVAALYQKQLLFPLHETPLSSIAIYCTFLAVFAAAVVGVVSATVFPAIALYIHTISNVG